jgi:hypothetical protein
MSATELPLDTTTSEALRLSGGPIAFRWPNTAEGQEYAANCMWHLASLAVKLPTDHPKHARVDAATAILEELAANGSVDVFDATMDIAINNWSQFVYAFEHPQAAYDAYFDACVIVDFVLRHADRDGSQ